MKHAMAGGEQRKAASSSHGLLRGDGTAHRGIRRRFSYADGLSGAARRLVQLAAQQRKGRAAVSGMRQPRHAGGEAHRPARWSIGATPGLLEVCVPLQEEGGGRPDI